MLTISSHLTGEPPALLQLRCHQDDDAKGGATIANSWVRRQCGLQRPGTGEGARLRKQGHQHHPPLRGRGDPGSRRRLLPPEADSHVQRQHNAPATGIHLRRRGQRGQHHRCHQRQPVADLHLRHPGPAHRRVGDGRQPADLRPQLRLQRDRQPDGHG